MDDIIQSVIDATSQLQLKPDTFVQCDEQVSKYVVGEVMCRFVNGNPRAWWLSLKGISTVGQPSDRNDLNELYSFVPPSTEKLWFIPETEALSYSVFEATMSSVISVLKECSFFEYYLVGRDFGWLLVENDHNEIIVVKPSCL